MLDISSSKRGQDRARLDTLVCSGIVLNPLSLPVQQLGACAPALAQMLDGDDGDDGIRMSQVRVRLVRYAPSPAL